MHADLVALRDVFRRSSLSIEDDRANLLANPDALELSDISSKESHRRVAALADGRIAGFATGIIAGEAIELDDLFVDPDCMGRGVGRALVMDIVEVARKHGVRRIEVTANEHALGFYKKAGFVFDKEVETRFGPALRMHLEVGPNPRPGRGPARGGGTSGPSLGKT